MRTTSLALAAFTLLSACWASPAAARPDTQKALFERLEGVWARDAGACQLHLSRKPGDPAPGSPGIVEFRSGQLDLQSQAAQCQLTRATRTGAGRFKFQAACTVNGQAAAESGTMTFRYGEHLLIQFTHGMQVPPDLTWCGP